MNLKKKKSMYLVTTLDVFHGNEFFGLFVPHEPSHPEIPSTYILHKLVLFHFFSLSSIKPSDYYCIHKP